MLSPEYSAILDKVWANFRPANELKPLAVLDFINSLLFIKQLDETQAEKGRTSALSGTPITNPIYTPEQQDLRWTSFQYLDQGSLFDIFYRKGGALDFAKGLPEYSKVRKYDKEDKPLVPPRFLLEETVSLINRLNIPDDTSRTEMLNYLLHKSEATNEGTGQKVPPPVEELPKVVKPQLITAEELPKVAEPQPTTTEIPKAAKRRAIIIEDAPKKVKRRAIIIDVPKQAKSPSNLVEESPKAAEPQPKTTEEFADVSPLQPARRSGRIRLPSSFYKLLVFLFIVAFAIALIYFNWKSNKDTASNNHARGLSTNNQQQDTSLNEPGREVILADSAVTKTPIPPANNKLPGREPIAKDEKATNNGTASPGPEEEIAISAIPEAEPAGVITGTGARNNATGELKGRYKIRDKAYFHNEPEESTRRNAFVLHWNNSYATLQALDEKNGFVYVIFRNHLNQTSKGWLRKKDLRPINKE